MKHVMLSTCIVTEKMEESKAFYQEHLDGKITFDNGWYVNLEFGDPAISLQLMTPQSDDQPKFTGGVVLNFAVEDADAAFDRLVTKAGLQAIMPLEDHPWGDRGFATLDPNGAAVYVFHETEPTEEFKQFFK